MQLLVDKVGTIEEEEEKRGTSVHESNNDTIDARHKTSNDQYWFVLVVVDSFICANPSALFVAYSKDHGGLAVTNFIDVLFI